MTMLLDRRISCPVAKLPAISSVIAARRRERWRHQPPGSVTAIPGLDLRAQHYPQELRTTVAEAIHIAGHTFTPRNGLVSGAWRPRPGRRIDYVLIRCGAKGATLDITACELAFAEPVNGTWASDHFGVVADVAALPPTADPP